MPNHSCSTGGEEITIDEHGNVSTFGKDFDNMSAMNENIPKGVYEKIYLIKLSKMTKCFLIS